MFQRGAGAAVIEGCDPSLEFQDDAQDLFAENAISGARAGILLGKAKKAGVNVLGKGVQTNWKAYAKKKKCSGLKLILVECSVQTPV